MDQFRFFLMIPFTKTFSMNKLLFVSLLFFVSAGILACSGEKKSGAGRPRTIVRTITDTTMRDSVEFVETPFEARQANDKQKLIGKWAVTTMRRQSKAELEMLSNCFIEFAADTSFSGKAPCNSIGGIYVIKGTSIRFSRIFATRMACDKLEQETWMTRLLEERIVAYTVTDDKLLLRDGSSNVVFECTR
jgi:heat shock protein HslJ